MLYCQLIINDPLEDKAKRLPQAITNVLKRIIDDWRRNTLLKHFQKGADQKYGYEPRSIGYQRSKDKKGLSPLVWSGRARDKITSPGHFKITGEKGSATGRIINVSSIRYFWMRKVSKYGTRDPNKAAETMRLADDEKTQIKRNLQQFVVPELNAMPTRRKIVR
jgi:hypothetical protein